jgi:hypothetical protein
VRGVAHNATDLIEVLWLAQGKCSPGMQHWLNFFMAKVQKAVIRSAHQATTVTGKLKIRSGSRSLTQRDVDEALLMSRMHEDAMEADEVIDELAGRRQPERPEPEHTEPDGPAPSGVA